MGIKGYNDACRGIIQRYTDEWRKTITRIGRWVDFDNDYKTMEPWYMESVWWVVKQLWEKELIYRGEKVVPFSTALGTVLSNFEAGSNYQEAQDPAVTVLFKLTDQDVYIAAWTTTPWTLPYVQIRRPLENPHPKRNKVSGVNMLCVWHILTFLPRLI